MNRLVLTDSGFIIGRTVQGKLEKSAKFTEKPDFYEGVLNMGEFAHSYDLRCYYPSPDMAEFVEHYFISRRRLDFDPDYAGEDILSQPVATLFFTPLGAFIQGPTTRTRRLIAKITPIYAGAQFRPGGFQPFLGQEMRTLAEKTLPATEVFTNVDDIFNRKVLALSNQPLLETMERLLRKQNPQPHPHLQIVEKIILYIEANAIGATVASVAKHFGMSERSLQHLFQVYVGVGTKWTIMRARFLEVIKFARAQDKLDWTQVANKFGYSDQAHFNNDFKKLVGVTPRQYEKSLYN